MNRIAILAAAAVSVFAHAKLFAADGPTAPYNEAVKIVNGKRVVEVLPFPDHMKLMVPTFKRPDAPGYLQKPVDVIETPQGLMDCYFTVWYHPKACAPSTFGREKRQRAWIVKMNGKWFGCASQAKPTKCVPIIVDGKPRAMPYVEE